MRHDVLESLVIENSSKIVLLVLDGVGDLPHPSHDGRTPLEAARTPHLDRIAPAAALGRILPVAPGVTPGSGPGHLALFGYDPIETKVGRGVLEALGAGFALERGDVAARANFCTLDERGVVTDRRAGRISSEACARLTGRLERELAPIEGVRVLLKPGKGHRFVAVLRGPGLAGDVSDADPHREGEAIPAARPLSKEPAAAKAARVVNALVKRMVEILSDERPANGALVRGLSSRPELCGYRERFKLRAAAVASYPMYRGVAELAGMDVLPTGETIGEAFATARARWGDFDFFFVHWKATDMAGEDGDFDAKVVAVEQADVALPALLDLKPDVLCVTGDHSTPVLVRGHSWHPVPLLVHGRWAGADGATRFHERNARAGSLGTLASQDLMALLMANAGRLDKYGA
ncbi:MAG: 2,3-bisphosphoglycerate-independent phosphoglycerate mutase [Candidatus Eisenbacteria bacterium]|uniref:2,3-bisphosphoglycerate-independent phosphoglycerate mutase n=1 Tax=Eiseniibacteriota bacterium TaxID=2212470 RepID=A0A538TD60_UNCEI|nr:MAG: 2,3-bisphosphoglycerate-independent phosphoglycerate mutase [Candidatus Eisenbacteria bacterium]